MEMPELPNSLPNPANFSENKIFSRKNIIAFLAIGIGLLVIPFSVKLVEQTNILKTRATGDEITFVPGDNISCDNSGKCTASDTKFQVILKSPLDSNGSTDPILTNLLTADIQNATITFDPALPNPNSNQKVQWFVGSSAQGTFSLSGSSTDGGVIQIDEYTSANVFVTTHANNSTFTTSSGNNFAVILRKASVGTATFSSVSLTSPTSFPTPTITTTSGDTGSGYGFYCNDERTIYQENSDGSKTLLCACSASGVGDCKGSVCKTKATTPPYLRDAACI